jgi:hypothetical protein
MRLHPAIEQERRQARQTLKHFVEGAARGDCERMLSAIDALKFGDMWQAGWKHALRRIVRLGSVPDCTRVVFLRAFVRWGDSIRGATGADATLLDALWVLTPRYRGKGRRLYRGASIEEWEKRRYGISWSASRKVADSHAQNGFYSSLSNRILMETVAEPAAIICKVPNYENRYGENEYLVDRRKLGRVTRIRAYPQSV